MRPWASADFVAVSAWALAGASGAGALVGLSHHALAVAVAFRALTAWRLTVAGRAVWRRTRDRESTVRFAALGSGAAHAALSLVALGTTTLGTTLPGLHRMCASAARCGPPLWAVLPLGVLGVAHAVWLWRHASPSVAARHPSMRRASPASSGEDSSGGSVLGWRGTQER